jgi:hypothetical protein
MVSQNSYCSSSWFPSMGRNGELDFLDFMYLWPTYYTLDIRMHILNLPQFKADLQILYVSQISFCGILYLAGYYIFITSR